MGHHPECPFSWDRCTNHGTSGRWDVSNGLDQLSGSIVSHGANGRNILCQCHLSIATIPTIISLSSRNISGAIWFWGVSHDSRKVVICSIRNSAMGGGIPHVQADPHRPNHIMFPVFFHFLLARLHHNGWLISQLCCFY